MNSNGNPEQPPSMASMYPMPQGRSPLVGCLLAFSLLLNMVLAGFAFLACLGATAFNAGPDFAQASLQENLHSGNASGKEKVAIVNLDGVIMEGMLGYVHKQIQQASKDKQVKAVVLRINSPGGSITASDELHQKLVELKQGNEGRKIHAVPHLVVSMGSLAASGGYYIAMPSEKIFAERTTMTGSIGVYASFPNVEGLAKQLGAGMITIKQGEIKDSGSPFKLMGEKEKQVWQDMVDQSYNLFVKVVEDGRPALKGKLLEKVEIQPVQAGPNPNGKAAAYQRYRADGGIYTADQALKFGLVDQIGNLDEAVAEAKKLANLSEDAKVIRYEKPRSFTEVLLDMKSGGAAPRGLDFSKLPQALAPRLWYLAPGAELSGISASLSTP